MGRLPSELPVFETQTKDFPKDQTEAELRSTVAVTSTSSIKDFINTGVFTLLYVIVVSLGMLGLLFGPVTLLITTLASVLVGGVVMLPYFARLHHPGHFYGLVIVMSLVMAIHTWITVILLLVFGSLTVLCLRKDRGRAGSWAVFGYAIFNLWYVGPLLPMVYMRDAFFADLANRHDSAWAEAMAEVFSIPVILSFDLFVFLLSLIGGYLGMRAIRSYFRPAGSVHS